MNHERPWSLRNKLRVLEGREVAAWVSLMLGIKEGTYCMEHWVLYANNESGTLHQKLMMYSMVTNIT